MEGGAEVYIRIPGERNWNETLVKVWALLLPKLDQAVRSILCGVLRSRLVTPEISPALHTAWWHDSRSPLRNPASVEPKPSLYQEEEIGSPCPGYFRPSGSLSPMLTPSSVSPVDSTLIQSRPLANLPRSPGLASTRTKSTRTVQLRRMARRWA